jgi:hypothetical protein
MWEIYSTTNAFVAIKTDGSITAWGQNYGGTGATPSTGTYTKIYSTAYNSFHLSWGATDDTLNLLVTPLPLLLPHLLNVKPPSNAIPTTTAHAFDISLGVPVATAVNVAGAGTISNVVKLTVAVC